MGSIGRFTSLFSLLRGVFPLFFPTLAVTALSDKSAAILLTHCAADRGAKTTGARLGREGLPFKKRRRQAIFLFNRGEIYAVVLFVLSRACVCEEREKSERVSDVVVFAPRKQERVREPEQQQRASNRGDLEKSDGEKCLFFSSSVSLALSLQTALSSLALDEPQELGDFRSRSLSLSLSTKTEMVRFDDWEVFLARARRLVASTLLEDSAKSTSTPTSATSIKKKRRKPRVARCIVKYDHSKGKLAVRVTDDVTVRAREIIAHFQGERRRERE